MGIERADSMISESGARNRAGESAVPATVLDGDEKAWREFVARYDGPLRAVVRHATEAMCPLDDDQVDDVLGDFWLSVVADDMRLLRSFHPARGSALLTWLTFHVAQVAMDHVQRMQDEPRTVPLHEARNVRAARQTGGGVIDLKNQLRALLESPEGKRLIASVVREALHTEDRAREPDDRLIDANAAAALLAMTPTAVRKAAFRGSLPCRRIGRKLRFVRSELLSLARVTNSARLSSRT